MTEFERPCSLIPTDERTPQRVASEVLAIIDATDGRYDQGTYMATGKAIDHPCGTQACGAGWATLLVTDNLRPHDGDRDEYGAALLGDGFTGYWDAHRIGRAALGLSLEQSAWLFEAERSLDEMRDSLLLIIKGNVSQVPATEFPNDRGEQQ